ncbi:hypothetical protein [uncultured Proteiniphilum sp.]|uniref:hypothetical protein n=1 Tax=uncultured Proteiniphilum sp. TaxID=497637 RepID=UPI002612FC9C|nr:hypothetical protein [uncultured Proteiniphilum sp.]
MKKNILILLVYLALAIVISPIRALGNIGVKLASLIGFVLFYLLTTVLIKRYTGKISAPAILFMGLLGISLVNLPFHMIHFSETLGTLLEYIIHLSAVIAGYYYVMIKNLNYKIVYNVVWIVIVLIASFYVNDLIFKTIFN